MPTPVKFRVATIDDVEPLVDLMVMSSWGGIRSAWERAKQESETWRDRGRAELSDSHCEIGFNRFVVAESGGRIAAMVLFNQIADTADIDPAQASPMEAGALRLIKRSQFSLFIREIATAEWARGKGLATELLQLAERVCRSNTLPRVTLIVNDANGRAERLYRAHGFKVIAEESSLGHPKFPDGSRLLLMEKRLPSDAPGAN